MKNNNQKSEILLYTSQDWTIQFDVPLEEETVWLNRKQMALLFDRDVKTIGKHINNVFREWELEQKWAIAKFATTATDGKTYQVEYYNLDVVISVWYRVKSLRWTQFRIWATQRLKEYLLQWYSINKKRLLEIGFDEFEKTLALIKKTIQYSLYHTETKWVLNFITQYAQSWLLLQKYDEGTLSTTTFWVQEVCRLEYEEAMESIQKVKTTLLPKKEVSETFWEERNDGLKGIFGQIYQSFDGVDLYPSIAEKAVALLYFVIKNHPFVDGNKKNRSFAIFSFFREK